MAAAERGGRAAPHQPGFGRHLVRLGGSRRRRVAGAPPVVDKWLRMNMPRTAYYHKHLMYNLGIALADGRIVTICDSDAMVRETLVESIIGAFDEHSGVALHLDEVRNVSRRFYPFN